MSNLLKYLSSLLFLLSFTSFFANIAGNLNGCGVLGKLEKKLSNFKLEGNVYCGGEPLFGGYVQVADGFRKLLEYIIIIDYYNVFKNPYMILYHMDILI